jgi:hypothetical protein
LRGVEVDCELAQTDAPAKLLIEKGVITNPLNNWNGARRWNPSTDLLQAFDWNAIAYLNDWNVLYVWNEWNQLIVDRERVQYKTEICIFL